MKRGQGRPQKLGDLIQRELSELLQRELRDPRVGMITITAVDVSPDISHAKVLYTTLDPAHVEAGGIRNRRGDAGIRMSTTCSPPSQVRVPAAYANPVCALTARVCVDPNPA